MIIFLNESIIKARGLIMKYFLAVHKGQALNNEGNFRKINLGKELDQENNLKALCDFTGTYSNEMELKQALNQNFLLANNEMHYNLAIGYKKDSFRFIAVPYQKEHEYLSYKKLEDAIYGFSKDKQALQVLISYYSYSNYPQIYNIRSELYSFRVYLSNPYEDYKFYDVVRSFVEKICFRTDKDKKTLNYRRMYDLGMLVSKLVPSKIEKQENSFSEKNPTELKPREDSIAYHKYEELIGRLPEKQLVETEENYLDNEIPVQRRLY